MAVKKFSGPQTGTAITTEPIYLRNALITAAAADATATIIGNGTNEIVMACKAGESFSYPSTGGGVLSQEIIPGPVTITITGAGAFVRISY